MRSWGEGEALKMQSIFEYMMSFDFGRIYNFITDNSYCLSFKISSNEVIISTDEVLHFILKRISYLRSIGFVLN